MLTANRKSGRVATGGVEMNEMNYYDEKKLIQIMQITQTEMSNAKRALHAAFGDVNTAVEYILNPSAMPSF